MDLQVSVLPVWLVGVSITLVCPGVWGPGSIKWAQPKQRLLMYGPVSGVGESETYKNQSQLCGLSDL